MLMNYSIMPEAAQQVIDTMSTSTVPTEALPLRRDAPREIMADSLHVTNKDRSDVTALDGQGRSTRNGRLTEAAGRELLGDAAPQVDNIKSLSTRFD